MTETAVALVDHYDSFTYNVLDWLAGGGLAVTVVPYDDTEAMAALARSERPLVISPGPKRPEDAPQTVALVRQALGRVPLLGICLGHQILAHAAGARIVRASHPCHGSRLSVIPASAEPAGIFAGIDFPWQVATYNSLVVEDGSLPPPWQVIARSAPAGEIQAIARHAPGEAPAYGLQFHPESFLSAAAPQLRDNWLRELRR